jgi:hypothetical protein
LHRENHSGDFIPYNLPEFFQGCEKQENLPRLELLFTTGTTQIKCANHYTHTPLPLSSNSHVEGQCFTKFSKIWRKMPPVNGPANY